MDHRVFEFLPSSKHLMIFSNRKKDSTYKILRNSCKTVKRSITVKSKNWRIDLTSKVVLCRHYRVSLNSLKKKEGKSTCRTVFWSKKYMITPKRSQCKMELSIIQAVVKNIFKWQIVEQADCPQSNWTLINKLRRKERNVAVKLCDVYSSPLNIILNIGFSIGKRSEKACYF